MCADSFFVQWCGTLHLPSTPRACICRNVIFAQPILCRSASFTQPTEGPAHLLESIQLFLCGEMTGCTSRPNNRWDVTKARTNLTFVLGSIHGALKDVRGVKVSSTCAPHPCVNQKDGSHLSLSPPFRHVYTHRQL